MRDKTVQLLLMRHCEPNHSFDIYLPDQERCLTEAGRAHATSLRVATTLLAPDLVYCSSLLRAVETAQLASPIPLNYVRIDERLNERMFPPLEGLTLEEISQRFGQKVLQDLFTSSDLVALDGVESLVQAQRRVVQVFAEIVATAAEHAGTRVLVISHGGPMSWLLCQLFGWPLRDNRTFTQALGGLHILEVNEHLALTRAVRLNSDLRQRL